MTIWADLACIMWAYYLFWKNHQCINILLHRQYARVHPLQQQLTIYISAKVGVHVLKYSVILQLKKVLSSIPETMLNVESLMNDMDVSSKMTRENLWRKSSINSWTCQASPANGKNLGCSKGLHDHAFLLLLLNFFLRIEVPQQATQGCYPEDYASMFTE